MIWSEAGGTGGHMFPALAAALILTLRLPGFRQLISGCCWTAGKWFSLALLRWFPKRGEMLENAIEDFLVDVVLGSFWRGANADDRKKAADP